MRTVKISKSPVINSITGDEHKIEDPDAPLVKRVQAGDSRAYDLLVLKHQTWVMIKIEQMLKKAYVHLNDVEDISQGIMTKGWKGLANFQGRSKFSTWLHKITIRQTNNYITKYNNKERLLKSIESSGRKSGFDAGDRESGDDYEISKVYQRLSNSDPYHEAVASEMEKLLKKCINELPYKLREAFNLCHFSKMSYQEIADATNTNVGTVKSRIFRARQQVRECSGLDEGEDSSG